MRSGICTRLFIFFILVWQNLVQPEPEKIKLEIAIETEIEILDGHHRSLFKQLI